MSLTTISGSIGLRVGDGRVGSSLIGNKRTSATSVLGAPPTAGTTTPAKIITKMVADNPSLYVPSSRPTTPAGSAATPTGGTPAAGESVPQPQQTAPARVGSRVYGKIILTLENVLLPSEKLDPTPSALDGLDPAMEMDLRITGCELISSAGILLKLPQTAMATGQVLFQRFYYSKSFLRQDMELTAMACIYLASKIEEAPRRIRDVINVFNHIKQLRGGNSTATHHHQASSNASIVPNYLKTLCTEALVKEVSWVSPKDSLNCIRDRKALGSDDGDVLAVWHGQRTTIEPMCLDVHYIRLKNEVTLAERRVLKELGFCVHVKHPHKLIVVYMQQLGCDKDSKFVQISWNYMSDALRTNVFVRYTPEAIACACIYLSARQLNIPLPTSPAWYIVFDVQEEQIIDICETILELYTRPKFDYIAVGKKISALMQEFKASRQGQRAGTLSDKNPTDTASPSSRPTSPNPGSEESVNNSAGVSKVKDSLDVDRSKDREKRKNDGSDQSGRKSAEVSPEPKKVRRSPSPIVFNDSPQRHKKKKRKKSRSDSSSPSRSRDRRSGKKHVRRERSRSRSPYSPKRQHHKKSKSNHRYRSRSRSHSPVERDERDRYDRGYEKRYYKKSSKSSKHPRDRDEDSISSKNRSRDKDRR